MNLRSAPARSTAQVAPLDLARDLRRPEAYPPPRPRTIELRETHVSQVFLTETDVYKVKKPAHFAFLDFSTLEKRRRACEAELQLNARMSPEVYLDLVPVTRDPAGRARLGAPAPGAEIEEWAVHMARLPDESRADNRLASGTLTPAHIDAIAEHVAAFHARAARGPAVAALGSVSAIARNVRENFAEVDAVQEGLLTRDQAEEAERFQLDFLRHRARVFERRRTEGRIVDGHGDLRLEHFYLADDGRITVLDCIEFSERFRFGDVCSDIAFLSMDLAAHGRVDLAERLLARYARASDDYELYALVDFYEAYRAYVRAKVSTLTARHASGELRARALADARRHFALALATSRRSLLEPCVVAVGGVIASGKSTVADALADRLSSPVVDADRTRKHLIGVAHTARDSSAAFEGAYDLRLTERVYAEVMHRASIVLESGRPVVLDASFRTAEMRRAARDLAAEHGVPFLFVECRVPLELCRARLERRAKETSVSDGRLEIFDAFVARVEPAEELPGEEHLVLDTSKPLTETLTELEGHLRTWPEGFNS